ncbi:MAG: family 78 glycoside hydrolase catalytic domain [Lachnospiraceae bacterium]|nr:family 78 glycoside hydrolase catalytic domain [Lachnospiraceae bacterium]
MLKIKSFQVEHMERGCVTDNPRPGFSWYAESDREDNEIREALLTVGDWSVRTRKQSGVIYRGERLKPMHSYEARLEITDLFGERASASLTFETGHMGEPFHAAWITDGSYVFKEKKVSPKPMYFRKEVQIPEAEAVERARVCVTALGLYELSVNGEKVGEDYLTPGFTSYRHEMQYQVYDVTDRIREHLLLEAVVTGGWAVGSYTYYRRNRVYGDKQAFLCELHLFMRDGSKHVIGTDGSWSVTAGGALKEADIYDGEVYDASGDPALYEMRPASEVTPEELHFTKHPNLIAAYGAPVRAHEELRPVSVTTAPSGERIYDMGQNFTGVVRARIRGRKGQKVVFRHAEVLLDGELCYTPLRSAKQRLEYICREGEQEYSPRFTYMGFRYVGVTGIPEENLELTALALYSDTPDCGSFTCSNEMLNRLQSAVRWGAKSNFTDIPTDCPQRDERLGWTGDIALFAPTACFNFDMSRFLGKWLLDVRSEQGRGGGIPMIVPSVKIFNQIEMTLTSAVDHWGDCCIWVPWAEYRARGDVRYLREMYPVMCRYIQACVHWAELGSAGKRKRIWSLGHHYGDWCAPDTEFRGWMKRGKYTATACLAYSAGIMAEIAEILGKKAGAAAFRKLKEETADAYRSILMDRDLRAKEEFQTAYVLPLCYGLLEGEERRKAAAHLARLVRENGWHIGTGFPGTPFILFALADNGYEEDAWKMLLTDTCPSWLYEIKTGGTTTWERWDALREDGTLNTGGENGSGGMVSFNHYAAGAVGDFFYKRIAGIEPLEAGYRRFRVKPLTGGGLASASASVMTAYGRAGASWTMDPGTSEFRLEVTVPVGSRCEITLPDGTEEERGSGVYRFVCRV